MDGEAPSFALNTATLAVIGALIGSLAGAISFLFRALVAAKDQQIAATAREVELQRQVMLEQIGALRTDRDYFRSLVLRDRGLGPRPRTGDDPPRRGEDDEDDAPAAGPAPPGPRRVR